MRAPSDNPIHQGRPPVSSEFYSDGNGNPTGGVTYGKGFRIEWQNGVKEPNGAIIEDVIQACIDRLRFFQGDDGRGKFSCRENSLAITHLEEGQNWLIRRTLNRQERGVEGTYSK